VTGVLLPRCRG